MRIGWFLRLTTAVTAALLPSIAPATAATIWNGPPLVFEKLDSADWSLPQNQDRITLNVWLTRGSQLPLFNAASESFAVAGSPADTQWAFQGLSGNPDDAAQITATNFSNLNFDSFVETLGSAGGVGSNVVGRPGVLHLISDDIYLDIEFTSWTMGQQGGGPGGGGFRYERSTPFAPGDFNGDGDVSAADYTVWRDGLGEIFTPGDYDVWKANYGMTSRQFHSVPEHSTVSLIALVVMQLASGPFSRTLRVCSYPFVDHGKKL